MSVITGKQQEGVPPVIAEIYRESLTEHSGESLRLALPGAVECESLKFAILLLL